MKAITRVYKYMASLGLKPKQFEELTGLSNGYLGKQKSREAGLGEDILLKILDNCPSLNPLWLLTGKGEMLVNSSKKNTSAIPTTVNESEVTYIKEVDKGIPLIPAYAMAGLSSGTISISEGDIMQYYNVPDFVNVDFMIRVKGSSMYPKYNSGDVVACRMINSSSFLQWNKVHVVATKEQGVLIKRLKKSDNEECLKAISDNISYDPFDIPKEEILNIALVVGVIRLE